MQMPTNFNFGGLYGNYKAVLKNRTSREYYGATATGVEFTLTQDTEIQNMMAMFGEGFIDQQIINRGIYVQSEAVEGIGNYIPRALDNRNVGVPTPNRTVYIPELNVVLFYSEAEREKAKRVYGNLTNCVKSYGCGAFNFFNASFTAFTPINRDVDFYTLLDGAIVKVPHATPEQVEEMIKRRDFDPDRLNMNYAFIMSYCVRSNEVNECTKNDTTQYFDVKYVSKAGLIKGEPLIQESSGLIIFDSRESADSFMQKYGSVGQYLQALALKITHKQYEEDLKNVNEQAAKDKNAMFNTFLFMGGTSLAAVLSESLMKAVNETDDTRDLTKKVFKICCVGTFAVAFSIGLYKTFKYFKIFNKKIQTKLENT